jgi:hypothetical protein
VSALTGRERVIANIKAATLLSQWPKKCGCGRSYTPQEWLALEQRYVNRDEYSTQDARDCICKSTLVVDVEIHDLDAE